MLMFVLKTAHWIFKMATRLKSKQFHDKIIFLLKFLPKLVSRWISSTGNLFSCYRKKLRRTSNTTAALVRSTRNASFTESQRYQMFWLRSQRYLTKTVKWCQKRPVMVLHYPNMLCFIAWMGRFGLFWRAKQRNAKFGQNGGRGNDFDQFLQCGSHLLTM